MKFLHDWVCWVLLVLGITCFFVGLFPQWSEWVDPANGERVSERRHGFWSSPSYQNVRRDRKNGEYDIRSGINWQSWSTLVIVIGFSSLMTIWWRLERPNRRTSKAAASEE